MNSVINNGISLDVLKQSQQLHSNQYQINSLFNHVKSKYLLYGRISRGVINENSKAIKLEI